MTDFVERNARELDRLRRLLARLDDDQLAQPVNESWTVAGTLGHMAFWDARAQLLAEKLERGAPFTRDDVEPDDVDWINDAARPLIHAVPPRELAELALRIATETDAKMAALATLIEVRDDLPFTPYRADHRGEHLDEIETTLS